MSSYIIFYYPYNSHTKDTIYASGMSMPKMQYN